MDIFYITKYCRSRVPYNNASGRNGVLCRKHPHGINPFISVFP
jgi:hypothetical protein